MAAYTALLHLIQPRHGSLRDTAALLLRQMTPSILGVTEAAVSAAGGRAAAVAAVADSWHAAAVRAAALDFTLQVQRWACWLPAAIWWCVVQ